MDIVDKRGVKGGQGNAAAGYSDFVARSGSWAYGADATAQDIEDESREEDLKFGVVHGAMSVTDPIKNGGSEKE